MRAKKEVFRRYLRENGLRFTPERGRILEAAVSQSAHFDAEELYLKLRRRYGRISKASVYRTIPLLVQCGLIRAVGHHDGRYHYEYIYGHAHHCHLRCLECDKMVEFTLNSLNEIEGQVGKKYRFIVTGHRLEFHGYCLQCSRAIKKNRHSPVFDSPP
ncbi:MAG: transcriptional repressor [Deltaproteobacteria bacterium]|nr:transcriptional repressor [Deltaproteobacteria bacterium]